MDELISGSGAIEQITSQGDSQFHNNNDDIIGDGFNFDSQSVQDWLHQLDADTTTEANNVDESETIKNEWANLDFVKYLLRLSSSIVLWSGVCSSFYNAPNTASSANVESYFKNVKQTLDSMIPCRVDEFVCAHIDMMEGMNKEASISYVEFIDAAGGLKSILNKDLKSYEYDSESEFQQFGISDESKSPVCDAEGGLSAVSRFGNDSIATECIACKDGNEATGAHKCIKRGKSVHILEGCSYLGRLFNILWFKRGIW